VTPCWRCSECYNSPHVHRPHVHRERVTLFQLVYDMQIHKLTNFQSSKGLSTSPLHHKDTSISSLFSELGFDCRISAI
jgi:hypothetical protein